MDKSKTINDKGKEGVIKSESEKSEVALREEEILAFWREHDIFKKTLQYPGGTSVGPAQLSKSKDSETKADKDFVFYDGPPFATGLPHYGHILAGTIKDAIPRFWTMNGYRVRRQWGWDCHGLPLENLIEKKLGLATKRDIEEYGIQNFNEAARSAVMEYADDWRRIIPRMGRFVDMDNDYKTMDSTYTESVWWVFSELNKKGLVYEGFKNMHLCPRCGTTLSNFEVNQGYKDIKDISVTVKLPLLDDEGKVTDTSLLVWTTTPWTLPGNMAAAVHEDYDYVKLRIKKEEIKNGNNNEESSETEYVILAKDRLVQMGDLEYEIVEEFKGGELVGKSYEPPFDYHIKRGLEGMPPHQTSDISESAKHNPKIGVGGKENAWKIYHADYVELGEEGTGAVHLAPAYGEEDMELAKKEGVPIQHHVDTDGHFMDFVTDFAGQLVKPKDDDDAGVLHLDADIEIVKALNANGKLFKKENITHSYPHCWRCDTPLLNYATTSWFVDVPKIRDELVAENKKVHWVPEHVGRARFGKWLEGAREWAVSRQRYWGAPLPIWRNPETKEYKIFGSLAELQEFIPRSGNTYYTMRHGESEKNVIGVVTNDPDAPYPLTEKGIEEVKNTISQFSSKVDLVISSPVLRARETAKLVVSELGLKEKQFIFDERLRETEHGEYEGKSITDYKSHFPADITKFENKPKGGESWNDLRQRGGKLLSDLEEQYKNKTILLVSHGDPMAMLRASAKGLAKEQTVNDYKDIYPQKGIIQKLDFTPIPHNDNYELDFHRPYIDDVVLEENGVRLERVPDVFDCWFESGSMPYGQHHYPFAHEADFNQELFPANFIAESIDQTRGWFYSLIVLGVALFGKSPYENVITNGLVLAEDGKKMSKSLQNYPDPMYIADTLGADSMRFYLLSSSIMRGEDLNFSEKGVLELQRKNIGRLHNVLAMYLEYADGSVEECSSSTNVLDKWIIARLDELIEQSTFGYKNYELDKATRPITDFIDDLSVWYLRRSRDRLKGTSQEEKELTLGTLRYVLQKLALVMAPAMPFYAEYLWGKVRNEKAVESVHLAAWPASLSDTGNSTTKADESEVNDVNSKVIDEMKRVREIVSLALEQRAKSSIKVRQPLALLTVKKEPNTVEIDESFIMLIKDEVNVKEVIFDESLNEAVQLDLEITPELQAEGQVRDFIRAVQDMRKKAGLATKDIIELSVQTSEKGKLMLEKFMSEIKTTTGAKTINFTNTAGQEIIVGENTFILDLKKV